VSRTREKTRHHGIVRVTHWVNAVTLMSIPGALTFGGWLAGV
jgi:hypothetical protein